MPSKTWTAFGPGYFFVWTPDAPHLGGSDGLVEAVEARLASRDEVAVTPTGPFLPAAESDPLAVLTILYEIVGRASVSLSGDAPAPPRLPAGAVG